MTTKLILLGGGSDCLTQWKADQLVVDRLEKEIEELKAQLKQRDANFVQLQKWADTELAATQLYTAREIFAEVEELIPLAGIEWERLQDAIHSLRAKYLGDKK